MADHSLQAGSRRTCASGVRYFNTLAVLGAASLSVPVGSQFGPTLALGGFTYFTLVVNITQASGTLSVALAPVDPDTNTRITPLILDPFPLFTEIMGSPGINGNPQRGYLSFMHDVFAGIGIGFVGALWQVRFTAAGVTATINSARLWAGSGRHQSIP